MESWIKISRELKHSEIWYKPDAWLKIWVYILMEVNHTDTKQMPRGTGFFMAKSISSATGATQNQVESMLKWGKSTEMLTTKRTSRGMFITALNYDVYQGHENGKTETKPEQNRKGTEKEPKRNRNKTRPITEERKNEERKNEELPEWLDKQAWGEWVQHRKEIKKPLTKTTIKKQLTFLEKDILTHIAIINQSIQNGWAGLFELKNNPMTQTQQNAQVAQEWVNKHNTIDVEVYDVG